MMKYAYRGFLALAFLTFVGALGGLAAGQVPVSLALAVVARVAVALAGEVREAVALGIAESVWGEEGR